VFVGMARDTKVKKLLKEGFEQAAKVVAERKQPKPEPPKPAEPAKPAGDGKPPEPKPEPAPEPKPEPKPDPPPEPKPEAKPDEKPAEKKPEAPKPKDPNLEVLADLLEGKRRAILQIGSAADLLHWVHACGEGLAFPRAVAVPGYDTQAGTLDMALDSLQKLKASVLLPPQLSTRPRSRYLIHPARILHEAGIEVGFRLAEEQQGARQTFFQLMELVRTGLPADVALRGVTLVPAKALGVDAEVGSLAVGKRADLLWFSGDPLDPVSELRSVWLRGQQVPERAP
jgi:hypothetical protein